MKLNIRRVLSDKLIKIWEKLGRKKICRKYDVWSWPLLHPELINYTTNSDSSAHNSNHMTSSIWNCWPSALSVACLVLRYSSITGHIQPYLYRIQHTCRARGPEPLGRCQTRELLVPVVWMLPTSYTQSIISAPKEMNYLSTWKIFYMLNPSYVNH